MLLLHGFSSNSMRQINISDIFAALQTEESPGESGPRCTASTMAGNPASPAPAWSGSGPETGEPGGGPKQSKAPKERAEIREDSRE